MYFETIIYESIYKIQIYICLSGKSKYVNKNSNMG